MKKKAPVWIDDPVVGRTPVTPHPVYAVGGAFLNHELDTDEYDPARAYLIEDGEITPLEALHDDLDAG